MLCPHISTHLGDVTEAVLVIAPGKRGDGVRNCSKKATAKLNSVRHEDRLSKPASFILDNAEKYHRMNL